jgi:ATP-binding cassette subfamily F protein 3
MLSVEEAESRIRGLRDPVVRPPELHLNLKSGARSGDLVLRTYNLAVGYPDEGRPLFRAPDLTLKRGECAALIGPNGAGKTTFLKTLLEKLPPLEGEVILGASLKIGYFAQAHEDLRPERALMEEIETVAPQMLPGGIRAYLAKFLFTGEEVFKRVSTLSGGERGRLALAKLSLTDANLLLLDEPTNHLDIPSQEILQAVLSEYAGTILLVSHDRYLIDALATQVWEIEPDEAYMRLFEGDYSQYRAEKEAEKARAAAAQAAARQASASQRGRLAPNVEDRRRKARLKEVEDRITALEEELKGLSLKLENPPADPGKVQKLGQEYVRLQGDLDQLMEEWEALHW